MHRAKEDGMEDGHPRFLNHDCGPVAECLKRNLSCCLFVVLLKVFTHCTFPYVHGSLLVVYSINCQLTILLNCSNVSILHYIFIQHSDTVGRVLRHLHRRFASW